MSVLSSTKLTNLRNTLVHYNKFGRVVEIDKIECIVKPRNIVNIISRSKQIY